jgi:chromosome partitioning protein
MVGHIIAVAQQKGGAGKTTLTAHLAVHWAARRGRVAILDIDPQASLTNWFRQRQGLAGGQPLSLIPVSSWRLGVEADRLRRDFDLVLIDCAPHAETDVKMAVRAADLVIVPLQLSPMDLWATGDTLGIARDQKRAFLLVLNRVPPQGTLGQRIRTVLGQSNLPIAQATLGNRQIFASALLMGKGVSEADPASAAATEIAALADELADRLGLAHAA